MRVLVCGSRDWDDGGIIEASLCGQYYPADDAFVVIHGAARGADSIARSTANAYGWQAEPFPADWNEHAEGWCRGDWCRNRAGKVDRLGRPNNYCYGAGPRRNQQMLDEGQPDICIAFKDDFNWKLDKGGTEDMVKRAKAAGVPTYVVSRA